MPRYVLAVLIRSDTFRAHTSLGARQALPTPPHPQPSTVPNPATLPALMSNIIAQNYARNQYLSMWRRNNIPNTNTNNTNTNTNNNNLAHNGCNYTMSFPPSESFQHQQPRWVRAALLLLVLSLFSEPHTHVFAADIHCSSCRAFQSRVCSVWPCSVFVVFGPWPNQPDDSSHPCVRKNTWQ